MPLYWTTTWLVFATLLGVLAAGHAILTKRDPRSALLWVGLVLFAPFIGAMLYALFGINRIERRATRVRPLAGRIGGGDVPHTVSKADLAARLGARGQQFLPLEAALDKVLRRPLVAGNRVGILTDGDETYPAMLDAIGAAQQSVTFATYIFEAGPVGQSIAAALGRAVARGVEVRVLIDDAGLTYSRPRATRLLEEHGVPHARFNPSWGPLPSPGFNMRNHRKICVVDGVVGFTGGLNVRQRHILADPRGGAPTRDLHFRIEGPIVRMLQEVFAEDWAFTTGERLGGARWFPALQARGGVLARAIAAGPDEDFDKLRLTLLSAIGVAQRSIRVVTPYFLPNADLMTAFDAAALRGIEVDLLVPERSNVPVFGWAMRALFESFTEHGCRVWLVPAPFDHAKLVLIDDTWAFIGSSNWDARSLRLNFEFSLECYDADLAAQIAAVIDARQASARQVTREELAEWVLWRRLRDRTARLLTPIL
ncbi:MAG: cardiolipin synthase [Planctomycetota bacterium]